MGKKLGNIIGMSKIEFDEYAKLKEELIIQQARLIPLLKPGDEMALTSIFLSSLRLIKEFRKELLNSIGMISSGSMYVYTEVEFLQFPENIIDGLIIIVKGGKIKDAALLEVKNKNEELKSDQIDRYLDTAKHFGVKKFITISNQFVSVPTQSPVNVKPPKNIKLFHFSWSYILTIAHILLFKNEKNIEDEDQIEIMNEVVNYLEHNDSGICGFTNMKAGWKDIVEKINAGSKLNPKDNSIDETVVSWHQAERDMALQLSQRLGLLVNSGETKFKSNIQARYNSDIKSLIKDQILNSVLRVDGAASNIFINANFDRRNIEMLVSLIPPQDRSYRGKFSWLRKQVEFARQKNEELFNSLSDELQIEILIKYSSDHERILYSDLDNRIDDFKNSDIKEFKIVQIKDLGKKFSSPRKFVEIVENMLLSYYQCIVQYLKKWEKPAPKMPPKEDKDVSKIGNTESNI